MKSISDVRLGFKDQEVLVTADIDMVEGDLDDLYFVMFNILDNPLRFVVAVAGNFVDFLVGKGYQFVQKRNDADFFHQLVSGPLSEESAGFRRLKNMGRTSWRDWRTFRTCEPWA